MPLGGLLSGDLSSEEDFTTFTVSAGLLGATGLAMHF
jgi:hypothetical protein